MTNVERVYNELLISKSKQRLHHRMVRVEKARRVYKHLRSGPCQLRHTASSDLK